MMKKILIIGVLIVICFVAGYLLLGQQAPIQLTDQASTRPAKELKLSDFPEVFKENTVIVIGENATQTEKESAERIAGSLENLTGKKPGIVSSKKIESFKYSHNLIIVGTLRSNPLLAEVYQMTDAARVTDEYPGEGKGILEILRNPWNEEKAILLVEGSDEEGMVAGINEVYWLLLSKKEIDRLHAKIITVVGTLKMPKASWSPPFDECFSPSPFIEANGKIYYLENICPYLYLFSGNLSERRIMVASESDFIMPGKTIKVAGILEEREVEVPLRKEPNPPTKIESFNVIVVSDLKVLNGSINKESSEVIVEVPKSIKLKALESYNLSGGIISVLSDDKIRILIDASMIPEIANICGVKYIEEYVMPQLPPKKVLPGGGLK